MKIIAPVNSAKEIKEIIRAGADEVFCGVLTDEWINNYGNVVPTNRRAWKSANISSFSELRELTDIAHDNDVAVNLCFNALYTVKQYPVILKQLEEVKRIGVDAIIVADLGMLLNIKKYDLRLKIHISTGGTTFNSSTVNFYQQLGVSRIVLPRHLRVEEIDKIVKSNPAIEFEVFVLNSGCKNIDGFCTFQHGVNEILYRQLWNFPKKANVDRHLLNLLRFLPRRLSNRIKTDIFGIDSACLLNYKVNYPSCLARDKKPDKGVLNNIALSSSLLYGVDSCGACRLDEFVKMGVYGLKIVGRNYSTAKKVKDVIFLKEILSQLDNAAFEKKEFQNLVKNAFKRIYKVRCAELCYYPDGM